MNRIGSALYHLLWYTVAIIIITAAILVTAIRLALPEIGGYKNEIQSWVSEYMDYPVVIDEISANWEGWVPNLHLDNIDLYTTDETQLIARFDGANLGIDILASIRKREIVPQRLTVSGLDLTLIRKQDGSISISNALSSGDNLGAGNVALAEWLLNQKSIALEKATLSWTDEKEALPTRRFENVQLAIRSDKDRVQLDASVKLPEEYGDRISLSADINGNVLKPEWDGEVYIQADGVFADELLYAKPISTRGGSADVKLWSRWDDAKLVGVTGKLHYEDIVLVSANTELTIKSILVNLFAERKNDSDWLIQAALADIETSNGLWPASTHELLLTRNDSIDGYDYTGKLSFIRLEELLPPIAGSGLLPENWLSALDWQSIRGELRNTEFSGSTSEIGTPLSFKSEFSNLSLASSDKQHRLSGLNGQVMMDSNAVALRLKDDSAEIRLGALFDRDMKLSDIDARLAYRLDSTPELIVDTLDLKVDDLHLATTGTVDFSEASPFIDMVGRIEKTELEGLSVFFPKQTKPKLKDWISKAFNGGELMSGDLLFHGYLNEYPFRDNEGIFQALLNIAGTTLDYKKDWPPIDDMTAEIIINNDDLKVESASGYIFDADVRNFSLRIDNLVDGNHRVILSGGGATGRTNDAMLFIQQSPLSRNPSLSELTRMDITGDLVLKLTLEIPLGVKNQTIVDGSITFEDTTIQSELAMLGLESVNGTLHFSKTKVWGENIDALYHGEPVKLTFPLDDREDRKSSLIISGKMDKLFLIEELTAFFPSLLYRDHNYFDYFDGEGQWNVTINKSRRDKDLVYRDVNIEFDLEGMALSFPAPFNKDINDSAKLSIDTLLVNSAIEQIDLNYDSEVFTSIYVDNTQDFKVEKILIGVGDKGSQLESEAHVSINGQTAMLNLDDWLKVFKSNRKDTGADKNRSVSVNLDVENLVVLNKDFPNTQFRLSGDKSGWTSDFDGVDIKGQVKLTDSNDSGPKQLSGTLEYLTVYESKEKREKSTTSDPTTVPELDVTIDDLVYKKKPLGKTRLITSNRDDSVYIEQLTFTKPNVDISANGRWYQLEGVNQTEINASLEAETLSDLLQTLNLDGASVDDGKTSITLNANWSNSPMRFEMDKVFGDLEIDIDKGQLLDVNPSSAGRLFGLLSVTALPRRLALDFSDLFSKGFAFDRIEGDFSIQNGQAYTNNLYMTAPAADISVSGRTGLVSKDYDQIATVTPKLSSSLPVASALFGPVGVGVGAVIFLAGELFESIPKKINKMLSYQYSITGSWKEPTIEKIKKEKQSG